MDFFRIRFEDFRKQTNDSDECFVRRRETAPCGSDDNVAGILLAEFCKFQVGVAEAVRYQVLPWISRITPQPFNGQNPGTWSVALDDSRR